MIDNWDRDLTVWYRGALPNSANNQAKQKKPLKIGFWKNFK